MSYFILFFVSPFHYFSHGLNADDKQWYLFNDARVSKANASDVGGESSYLLF